MATSRDIKNNRISRQSLTKCDNGSACVLLNYYFWTSTVSTAVMGQTETAWYPTDYYFDWYPDRYYPYYGTGGSTGINIAIWIHHYKMQSAM